MPPGLQKLVTEFICWGFHAPLLRFQEKHQFFSTPRVTTQLIALHWARGRPQLRKQGAAGVSGVGSHDGRLDENRHRS